MAPRQTLGSQPAKLLVVVTASLLLWLILGALTSWIFQ